MVSRRGRGRPKGESGTRARIAAENRWRHHRHVVSSAVRALGLRLTVEATHGSPHAMVHAIRALTADTPAQ